MSPLIAGEIALRLRNTLDKGVTESEAAFPTQLWVAFHSVMGSVRDNEFSPVAGANAKGKMIFLRSP